MQHPLMLKWGPFPKRTVKLTEGVIKGERRRKRTYFHFILQCWDKDWANMQPCCWNPWGPAEWWHVMKIHQSDNKTLCHCLFMKKLTHTRTHTQWSNTKNTMAMCVWMWRWLSFESRMFGVPLTFMRNVKDGDPMYTHSNLSNEPFARFVFLQECRVVLKSTLCWPSRRIYIF